MHSPRSVYPYGLIGNCQAAALVSDRGSIDWLCLPRPDSEPVFGRLLDPEGGHFFIDLEGEAVRSKGQRYLGHSPILVTEIQNGAGDAIRITDFCPRFEQLGRMFRPCAIFRKVEPTAGSPRIRAEFAPVQGWNKVRAEPAWSSQGLRAEIREELLNLTTSMPLALLKEGRAFALKEPCYFVLTWGADFQESLVETFEGFLQQTLSHWQLWVKHCSIPSTLQNEVIRSAITLKLHCYEDTGAILAALTTSLPEERGSTRNWDYRYCWLRDSYFALSALHQLGHFEEMEGFLKFLLGVAEKQESARERLAPVYTLSQGLPLPEITHLGWQGYGSSTPVRTGNQAAEHVQNDVYGELILTIAPIFLDERFVHLRTGEHLELLLRLGEFCERSLREPDAGLWEVRNHWQEHSFTHLMCWAGLDRLCRIFSGDSRLEQARQQAVEVLESGALAGILRNGPRDDSLDAALSLAGVLRFPREELVLNTLRSVTDGLRWGRGRPDASYFYRYLRKDDFGRPQSAFLICSFWVAQAIARLRGSDPNLPDPRGILEDCAGAANRLGLLSEHFDPQNGQQLGNFPQVYSHVGLINAAFAVSPPWSEVL